MGASFVSRLADLSDSAGWAQLPSGVWVTRLPLLDIENDVFAELSYALALEAAKAFGAHLPSAANIVELNAYGFRIEPVTLPTKDMVHGLTEAAIDAYRNENMMSLAWAKLHDEGVRSRLDHGWDSKTPVANAGKHWEDGAPPGRAWLMGWFAGGHFIQPGSSGQGPHNDLHHDYGTTTILVRDSEP